MTVRTTLEGLENLWAVLRAGRTRMMMTEMKERVMGMVRMMGMM
jgi:hypothetical protein